MDCFLESHTKIFENNNFEILIIVFLVATGSVNAEDVTTVRTTDTDISDNLDLEAVASLFGEAKDLEEFEKKVRMKPRFKWLVKYIHLGVRESLITYSSHQNQNSLCHHIWYGLLFIFLNLKFQFII